MIGTLNDKKCRGGNIPNTNATIISPFFWAKDVKKHTKAFLEELKKCKADTITGNKFLILSEEWLDEIAQKHFGGIEE